MCVCGSTPQVCPRPFSTRGPPASPRGPQGSLSRGLRKKENLHLHNFVGVGLSRPGSTGPPKGSTRIVHEQSFHRQYFVRLNVSRPGSTGPPKGSTGPPKGSTRIVHEQSFHRQYFVRPNVSRPGSTGPPPRPQGVHEARNGGPRGPSRGSTKETFCFCL